MELNAIRISLNYYNSNLYHPINHFFTSIVFFNLLCAVAGVVLIVHGGLALAKVTELRSILSNDNLSEVVPAIVIVIGVLIFLISFLGCVGALQSNICLLETYSICLLVLVLFQVVLACLIFLFVDDIKIDSGRSFSKIWRSRGNSANSQTMIELIQENLECCGYNNFLDYSNSPKLPKSCCNRHAAYCAQQFAYEVGCQSKLQTSIKNSAQIISYTCIGTAIFELIGAIMGFVLSGYLRKVYLIHRWCFRH